MSETTKWEVVVKQHGTGERLASYIYDYQSQAQEAARSIREVRVKQNHERISVLVFPRRM